MAEYRFLIVTSGGTGTVLVNGDPPLPYYEEGTSLTVETFPDNGFTVDLFAPAYSFNNGYLSAITNPYTFNMPSRDLKGKVTLTGVFEPPAETTGLKYYSEFCDLEGKSIRLEILEDGYVGPSEARKMERVNFQWGEFGQDEIDPIVRSFVDFSIIGTRDEFVEMLDGGYRKWQVKLFVDSNLFWMGYINNNILTLNEHQDQQAQRFTASDGFNAFEARRVIQQYFEGFLGGSSLGGLYACLNQTFSELRPLNVACDIYETRLDTATAMFEQILIPDNAVYTDGELPLYFGNTEVAVNTSVYISEFLDNMLKPFLCRVFLWQNEFYIISTPELAKNSYRLFKYDNTGSFVEQVNIDSGFDLVCRFIGQRTARSVYTEFTGTLELGVMDYSARGGFYEEPFGEIESWFVGSDASAYPGVYILRKWNYINAIPSNQPSSFPLSSGPALIQYISDGLGTYCKIWGTTTTDALTDTNLSYIELDSTRTGQDIPILQELANVISIKLEFMLQARSGDPLRSGVNFAMQVQIGSNYLVFDGVDEFTWSTTPTVMLFPLSNIYVWNKLDIISVPVPEDGNLFVRIYETVVTNSQAVDRYAMGIKDLSIKIEENDAYVTEEISAKFITDESYSVVYPEVIFKIGDVDTANSSSAIKLDLVGYGYPASELWSRDGIEELPLLNITMQEIANIKGKQNPRIVATILRDNANPLDLKPYQNVIYDGYLWVIIALEIEFGLANWRVELARLGEIPSS